jgi:tRNA1(Val) A37 N6-methylase TrmN6
MNPPFNDPIQQNASPDAARRLAHVGTDRLLATWVERAASLVNANGIITVIWRAAGLADVLQALDGFGGISVLPIHPKPKAAAIRVIVSAVRGGSSPLVLWPPLTLNDAEGRPSAEAEAILRGGMPLTI